MASSIVTSSPGGYYIDPSSAPPSSYPTSVLAPIQVDDYTPAPSAASPSKGALAATRRVRDASLISSPGYARSNPIIHAGQTFPVLLDTGVFVALALIDVPYRVFGVRVQTRKRTETLPYAAVDHQQLSAADGGGWCWIVPPESIGEAAYARIIRTHGQTVGPWRFVDARQATTTYHQGRFAQEKPFLEILVGDSISQEQTQWMISSREGN